MPQHGQVIDCLVAPPEEESGILGLHPLHISFYQALDVP